MTEPLANQHRIRQCVTEICSVYERTRERGRRLALEIGESAAPALVSIIREHVGHAYEMAIRCLIELGEPAYPHVRPLLSAQQAKTRDAALRVLLPVRDPEAIEAVREWLKQNYRGVPFTGHRGWDVIRYGTVPVIGFVLTGLASNDGFLSSAAILVAFSTFFMQFVHLRMFDGNHTSFERAAQVATHREFDILCMILTHPQENTKSLAVERIVLVAPSLERDDVDRTPSKALRRALRHSVTLSPTDQLTLVAALGRVGDARCIPHLMKIVHGRAYSKQIELKEQAQKAIAAIRERVDESSTLLRPADAPSELLRPVTIESEQLLRPASEESEEVQHETNS